MIDVNEFAVLKGLKMNFDQPDMSPHCKEEFESVDLRMISTDLQADGAVLVCLLFPMSICLRQQCDLLSLTQLSLSSCSTQVCGEGETPLRPVKVMHTFVALSLT